MRKKMQMIRPDLNEIAYEPTNQRLSSFCKIKPFLNVLSQIPYSRIFIIPAHLILLSHLKKSRRGKNKKR
jgi:hypothetical protein